MKATGIVRNLDSLGRIVLPMELRKQMGISNKDDAAMEVFVDGADIILRRYLPGDFFTGDMEDLVDYKGYKFSKKSIIDMARAAGLSVS